MKKKIRKIHRYLGVFIGVQFIMWTLSGLYFSWTDIDEIHGDQFKNETNKHSSFTNLISPTHFNPKIEVNSIQLREINHLPYYWVNKEFLYSAVTGKLKSGISNEEALSIAKRYMKENMVVQDIQLIANVDKHHEYRERLLPAYVVSYKHQEDVKAYVSVKDGAFQTVRHRSWRWFDFLWMTHTMDYEGRDNFNSIILRTFSLLGLITVLSGFLLWYISSSSIRKITKKIKRK